MDGWIGMAWCGSDIIPPINPTSQDMHRFLHSYISPHHGCILLVIMGMWGLSSVGQHWEFGLDWLYLLSITRQLLLWIGTIWITMELNWIYTAYCRFQGKCILKCHHWPSLWVCERKRNWTITELTVSQMLPRTHLGSYYQKKSGLKYFFWSDRNLNPMLFKYVLPLTWLLMNGSFEMHVNTKWKQPWRYTNGKSYFLTVNLSNWWEISSKRWRC